jgi:LacI family gluconate utilization system Gnt-I transcriptional repressor
MSDDDIPQAPLRMRDVARLAAVSTMTVSRALNDPGKVSAEVRRRVEAAVRELGYVPNRVAGSLSSRRSRLVGLIVPTIDNSLYSSTIQAVSEVLRRNGYQLMIADCGYDSAAEASLIGAFLAQQAAGLILHNASHGDAARELIRRAGVPVVEIGNQPAAPLDMVVSYSNHDAARAMTQHLARLGYRRIGMVTLPAANNDRSRDRLRGYRAALAEAGLADDPRLVLEMPPGLQAGAEAVVRLAGGEAPADAIFFAGDVLAVGALFECQRRGWPVPGRVALAAFDNIDLLRHVVPRITTLRLPRVEIGRQAAELLLERIQGRASGPRAVDLGFEILHRAST